MWETIKDIGYWLRETISAQVLKKIIISLIIIMLLYYPVGMFLIHKVDANPDFGLQNSSRGSNAVAVSIALIDREVNQHGWVANDPIFKPGAMLDNMPNFQQGIISAIARFSYELVDQLGRTRGSSAVDPDLQEVSGLLQYAGDIWWWNPSTSLLPVATSEQQYTKAMEQMIVYNERLARGAAVFEKRSDNLLATLDRISLDLGASSASIDTYVKGGFGCVMDFGADDLFFNVKGQAYAYRLILKALRKDFSEIIETRDIASSWDEMETSFDSIISMDPLIVSNCEVDGFLFQNHLAAEGFYLLRARTQLKEITNILLK
ncbi:DUF2333 family protein [Pseudemcibacter aquimaris]|uniref:DUF2333 family protein n=1 Tax=Pseudemcibacter aquimaris TaxID=2857064 RepID=UPI002013545F|nr:DUF2333 family protein [Pseudemcibacter aquimaris]MCC3862359.1 DUF2333 family protein [Pseudemcibacter aquimaris]WDU59210.1 DUF2333 family protein [Pseudemcibacter aquimaris]